MRFLTFADFSRQANKPDIMSDIATFKIPKGMVYAFSTRLNMSLYIMSLTIATGDNSEVDFTLGSSRVECADLGGSELAGEDQKDQIVAFVSGVIVDTWDFVIATGIVNFDTAPPIDSANDIQIISVSNLDTDPTLARATSADYMGTLEIRAEAPAGQNIGIPIFSGSLGEIMGNTQNFGLTPLKLHGAVLLPEGFILAVKILAPAAAMAGDETLHTAGTIIADNARCAERIRIPFERFALRDFPRDFKAKVLVSMSSS